MKLLAFDTATEALSVALLENSDLVSHRFEVIGRGHAERLLPAVSAALRDVGWSLHELDAIAVGRGPGAFTGVRIGISAAQGLAFGANLPVVPVSDLAAVATAAVARARAAGQQPSAVLVAMDARMGEVYAAYASVGAGAVVLPDWERLCAPSQLSDLVADDPGLLLAGHGFSAYPTLVASFSQACGVYADQLPDAAAIGRIAAPALQSGDCVSAEALEPVYLRDDVAHRSGG
jgi:tRNA threonylcarbamoyladenosine biosynthesis protein TsaB